MLKTNLTIVSNKSCKTFSKKCTEHAQNKRLFPLNVHQNMEKRNKEKFKVNFAYTAAYKNSAIPYCQRLLNQLEEERREGERRAGGSRRGEEEEEEERDEEEL